MMTKAIPEPPADSALMLIDFQADFINDDGRMPVARRHVEPMIAAAADAIERFKRRGRPIVAVGNEFRRSDVVMNLPAALRERGRFSGSALGRPRAARRREVLSQMGRKRLRQS